MCLGGVPGRVLGAWEGCLGRSLGAWRSAWRVPGCLEGSLGALEEGPGIAWEGSLGGIYASLVPSALYLPGYTSP